MSLTLATPPSLRFTHPDGEGIEPGLDADKSLTQDLKEYLRLVPAESIEWWLQSISDRLQDAASTWEDPLLKRVFPIPTSPDLHVSQGGSLGLQLDWQEIKHIVLDAKLITDANSTDLVAFVLAHELGHIAYRSAYGIKNSQRASATEEMFCDRFGLEVMTRAGFSPKGAVDFFDMLLKSNKQDSIPDAIKTLILLPDEHLTNESRWAQVKEDYPGIARLQTGVGPTADGLELTPIPPSIQEEATALKYHCPFLEYLESMGFSKLSDAEQLDLLGESVDQLSNPSRFDSFKGALLTTFYRLQEEYHITSDAEASIHKIMDVIFDRSLIEEKEDLTWKDIFHSAYYHAGQIGVVRDRYSGHKEKLRPLGKVREIAEAVQELLQNEDAELTEAQLEDLRPSLEIITHVPRTSWGSDSRLKINWGIEEERAFEIASLDPSGRKAVLLFYTVLYRDSTPRFYDSLPLEVSLAAVPLLQEQWSGLNFALRDQVVWNRDIHDYESFRKNPELFLLNYRDLLAIPGSHSFTKFCKAHPYSPLNKLSSFSDEYREKGLELHREWAPILISHIERYREENPDHAEYIIRSLLLPSAFAPEVKDRPSHPAYSIDAPSNEVEKGVDDEIRKGIQSGDRRLCYLDVACGNYPWDAPLLEFALRQRSLFSDKESLAVFLKLSAERDIVKWEEGLGRPLPGSLEEISKVVDDQKHILSIRQRHYFSSREDATKIQLIGKLLERALRATPQTSNSAEIAVEILEKAVTDPSTLTDEYYRTFREALRELVFTSPTVPAEKYYEDMSVEGLLRIVRVGERYSLFSSPLERDRASEVLSKRIPEIRSLEKRQEVAAEALKIPPLDLVLRDAAAGELAKIYKMKFGLDDGTSAYSERILEAFREESKSIIGQARLEFARRLADEVVSQRELSFALRGETIGSNLDNHPATLGIKGAEALLRIAGRSEQRAEDTLKFLLAPLSLESTEEFRNTIGGWRGNFNHNDDSDVNSLSNTTPKGSESSLVQIGTLYTTHRHFSALTLEGKAIILKQLLIAPERLYNDEEQTYKHAIRYTVDKLFPEDVPGATEKESKTRGWCRLFVEAYITSAHESERGLLLAALLSASQAGGGRVERPGVQLKRILEHLGPAYIKLGQAIHSYPGTPEDIRKDIAGLKGMASQIARWDLHELLDRAMPTESRASMASVGPVVGAASFNIVAKYREHSGIKPSPFNIIARLREEKRVRGAVSVLRAHSRDRARKGFEDLERVVDKIVNERPELEQFRHDAVVVIRHARDMSDTETNMRLGAIQQQEAHKQYNGLSYLVNGLNFRFTTAHWREHGDDYRKMDEAPGVPFDELKERTPLQRRYKRAVAKAILTAELENILAGAPFDYDRHERQYHIKRGLITALDHGGLSLSVPTEEDRNTLARVVGKLFAAADTGSNLTTALSEALHFEGAESDYVQRLQKGLLALAFTFQYLDSRDVAAVVASCLLRGRICSEVKNEIRSAIPEASLSHRLLDLPEWLQSFSSWAITGVKEGSRPDKEKMK